jgi:N utilization substance protein B
VSPADDKPQKPRPKSAAGPADTVRMASMVRSQARLAAVQALYQMDLAATDLNKLVHEFTTERFGPGAEDETLAFADKDLFEAIVRGVVAHQAEIDPTIDAQLATGWRLNRIDSTVRATLRSAFYELRYRKDVPPKVVISEYVEITKAYFDGDEPKLVNAVLDKLARKERPQAFGA